jgi:DNA-binding GntR family transcriptional regulator
MAEPVLLQSQRAYEQLHAAILSCEIAPGSEISEAQLATGYPFGRPALRGALTKLAQAGLVRAVPRRGYRVVPITPEDIHDLFELRLMLEPAAARMAAGKVSAQRLEACELACRAGYRSGDAGSTARFLDSNKAFHVAIAQATGNGRLARAIDELLSDMTRLLHLGLRLRHASPDVQPGHTALTKALARGDGESAERLCREHIEAARSNVLSAIVTSNAMANVGMAADGA